MKKYSAGYAMALVGCLFFVFIVRYVYLINFSPAIDHDSLAFDAPARDFFNFLWPKELTEIHVGPVQPAFLAAVYFLFGKSYFAAQMGQIFIDVITAYLIFVIGRKIFGFFKVSLLAVILFAVYPSFIWHTTRLYSEPLFAALIAMSMFFCLESLERNKKYLFFITGLCLGIASLCRPVLQLFPLFLCAMFIFIHKKQQILIHSLFLFFGFIIAVSPWTVRNYLLTGKFIPINASSGYFMLYANSRIEDRDLLNNVSHDKVEALYKEKAGLCEDVSMENIVAKDKCYHRIAVDLIKKHPFRYILLCLKRFVMLWFNVGYGYKPSILALMVFTGNLILISLFITGLVYFKGAWIQKSLPIIGLLVYFTLMHMLTTSVYRFIVPVMPFLLLFDAYVMVKLWEKIKKKSLLGWV